MAVSVAHERSPLADQGHRLGLDQPAGWWPTASRLKSYEAGGFDYVQARMPPRRLLADSIAISVHGGALRDALALTGLRLILHAPDDLTVGDREHDRQFAGALEYASLAGAELLVYHGMRVPAGAIARLAEEESSLVEMIDVVSAAGVQLAIENLAPVYPDSPRLACQDPGAVAALVRRLQSDSVGMCLDLGHAHIAAELAGCPLPELVAPLLGEVVLFHVHDNFGARLSTPRAGGIDPLKLDLHLAPGAGTVPFASLRGLLERHAAPLQLEVHPARRPEPGTLAILAREVLGLGTPAH